jgi:hypothetical protein
MGHLTDNPELVEHHATVARHLAIAALLCLLLSFLTATPTQEHVNNITIPHPPGLPENDDALPR